MSQKSYPLAVQFIFCAMVMLLSYACGMQLTVPAQTVQDAEIAHLTEKGFVHVGERNILEMQSMKRPLGMCKKKQNICGMQAGISAGFLLQPREAFYDVVNPPTREIFFGDGSAYDTVANQYPIMRSKEFKNADVGVLPTTLAKFWTKQFTYFKAIPEPSDDETRFFSLIKDEIRAQRPVLVQVRITTSQGLPVFMPDKHLALPTFFNAHWIVVVGFSEQGEGEWLIRDNGGLVGTVEYQPSSSLLLKIADKSFRKLANTDSLAEDLKLYLDEPDLPIFLDDAQGDEQAELKEDFKNMKKYNLIRFEKN